ncbi:MAG TPA: TIGR02147 family protein [Bdellovibrionota bacterium]|nr:TIGR02147 family protein [Bdellovibrionota bacterium]
MVKKCFDFSSYKDFLTNWISAQPRRGRGLQQKLAQHLRIHTTMISHILRGNQHFTDDQGLLVAEYIGLTELETEYFLTLLRLDRAATQKLKERIKKRLLHLREQGQDIKNRISSHYQLAPEDSARFYSNWFLSALRLLADIPEYQSRAKLLEALDLPRNVANDAINFLVDRGLIQDDRGRIVIGPSRTHLPSDSPYIWTMHKNWRMKAIERHARHSPSELFYSAPMSIAKTEISKIRELLVQLTAEVTKIAGQSKPEKLVALNFDWFEVY